MTDPVDPVLTDDEIHTIGVLTQVAAERAAQDARFGPQNWPDGTGPGAFEDLTLNAPEARRLCDERTESGDLTFADILAEEVAEALAEVNVRKLRKELIQVAAVAVLWAQKLDREFQWQQTPKK